MAISEVSLFQGSTLLQIGSWTSVLIIKVSLLVRCPYFRVYTNTNGIMDKCHGVHFEASTNTIKNYTVLPYCILGNMEVCVFLAKNITQKQYLPSTLAVLVRHNQA